MTAIAVDFVSFHDWILQQIHRNDRGGILAKDIASEEKRIGRKLDATVNLRVSLYCYVISGRSHTGLSAEDVQPLWDEWRRANEERAV